jgi:transketolase
LPSWEPFDRQTDEYRDSVLPPEVTGRVVIEQASSFGWDRWAGTRGEVIAMGTFGASAPLKALQSKFGFTPEAVGCGGEASDRPLNSRATSKATAPSP